MMLRHSAAPRSPPPIALSTSPSPAVGAKTEGELSLGAGVAADSGAAKTPSPAALAGAPRRRPSIKCASSPPVSECEDWTDDEEGAFTLTVSMKCAAQSDADTEGAHGASGGWGGGAHDLVEREQQQQHRSLSFGSGSGGASIAERTQRTIGVKMISDIRSSLQRTDSQDGRSVCTIDLTALQCYAVELLDRAPSAATSRPFFATTAERLEAKLMGRDAFQLALKCTGAHRSVGLVLNERDFGASALTFDESKHDRGNQQDRLVSLLKQLDWQVDTAAATTADWAVLLKEHVEICPKPFATSTQEILSSRGVDVSAPRHPAPQPTFQGRF